MTLIEASFECLQIMEFVVNRSLVKVIEQVIDEDGSIKDSAVCFISRTSFLYLILHVICDNYCLLLSVASSIF